MSSQPEHSIPAQQAQSGYLYLVGTPIGNLHDFSSRARDILSTVSVIACEDTRTSGSFLRNMMVTTPLTSYHQHNEHVKTSELIRRLEAGDSVALISDAGMPAISDPGFLLAKAAHHAKIPVVPIPGPVAATTALAASGLPSDRFIFEGFLPPKKGRQTRIKLLADEERTAVIYESPHRIVKLLKELLTFCEEERLCCIGRELTKMYEEVKKGTLLEIHDELAARPKQRGEFVFILGGKSYREEIKEG